MRTAPGPIAILIMLGVAASGASLQARSSQASQPVDEEIATAAVELDGTVLFRVRGTSSYPAEARAQAIHERLIAVADDRSIPLDAVQAVESDGAIRIVAADRTIVSVLDADAALERVTPRDLATAHLMRVRQAIEHYRAARSPSALRASAVTTLAATLVLAFTAGLVVWVWRWLDRRLTQQLHTRIQTVGIQSFEVMRADRIWKALRTGLFGLRTLVFLALTLVYVGYVLAQWPWTHGLSADLVGFVLAPLQVIGAGIVEHIPGLVFLLVLFYVFRFALRVLRLFFEAVERGTVTLSGFDAEWAQPTYKIVRMAIVAFGLVVAYPYIPGSQSAAFKGVSVFLGIVFSLGSSSAISNIIAGYTMTYRRAFRLGDRVKIGSSIGDVIEMRLQVTHLRSFKNEEIVIPNSQILAGEVINYSSLARQHGLILHTEVGIGYETPWRQVEAMLLEAVRRTPGVRRDHQPFVLMSRLADFAVVYEANMYCDDPKMLLETYTALHRNILDVFNEYGVQIMTPAYMHDPAAPKVVPPDQWYLAPASSQAGSAAPSQADRPAPSHSTEAGA